VRRALDLALRAPLGDPLWSVADEDAANAAAAAVVRRLDLHGGNVLRAGRQAWAAIDPKPLVASAPSTSPRFCATAGATWPPTPRRCAGSAVASTP
jgi:hypothetical protein